MTTAVKFVIFIYLMFCFLSKILKKKTQIRQTNYDIYAIHIVFP